MTSLDRANILLRRTQSELVAARQAAEEAQVLKEQFAANISHELRTPLNLILGFSELMYLSPDVYGKIDWTPDLRQAVHQIYQNSRHLTQMIDDILDLSRFEISDYSIQRELTPVADVLNEAAAMMKDLYAHGRCRLETSIPPDLPAIVMDRTRIRQVLINLLTNAHRFTPEGVVRLSAVSSAVEVTVSVSDSGPGIPDGKLERVFDEFYQVDGSLRRKNAGAGLGLAISKRFVAAHHGRIWAENNPAETNPAEHRTGAGASFRFTLPLAMPDAPAAAAEGGERAPSPASSLVFVVDRDAAVASLVRRHLEPYEVMQIEDGAALNDAVLLHHPAAVVLNSRPGAPPA